MRQQILSPSLPKKIFTPHKRCWLKGENLCYSRTEEKPHSKILNISLSSSGNNPFLLDFPLFQCCHSSVSASTIICLQLARRREVTVHILKAASPSSLSLLPSAPPPPASHHPANQMQAPRLAVPARPIGAQAAADCISGVEGKGRGLQRGENRRLGGWGGLYMKR